MHITRLYAEHLNTSCTRRVLHLVQRVHFCSLWDSIVFSGHMVCNSNLAHIHVLTENQMLYRKCIYHIIVYKIMLQNIKDIWKNGNVRKLKISYDKFFIRGAPGYFTISRLTIAYIFFLMLDAYRIKRITTTYPLTE